MIKPTYILILNYMFGSFNSKPRFNQHLIKIYSIQDDMQRKCKFCNFFFFLLRIHCSLFKSLRYCNRVSIKLELVCKFQKPWGEKTFSNIILILAYVSLAQDCFFTNIKAPKPCHWKLSGPKKWKFWECYHLLRYLKGTCFAAL